MTEIEYLDRPPAGWFVLEIMKVRGRNWVALMIDVDPKQSCWIRIAGKQRPGRCLGCTERHDGYAALKH
jgi:hypothetical protein